MLEGLSIDYLEVFVDGIANDDIVRRHGIFECARKRQRRSVRFLTIGGYTIVILHRGQVGQLVSGVNSPTIMDTKANSAIWRYPDPMHLGMGFL